MIFLRTDVSFPSYNYTESLATHFQTTSAHVLFFVREKKFYIRIKQVTLWFCIFLIFSLLRDCKMEDQNCK
jgi:hypothetical protein